MRLKQKIIRDIIYYSVRCFLFIIWLIPYSVLTNIGARLGKFAFRFFQKDQKIIQQNLNIAFPEKSPSDIQLLQEKIYEHISRSFFEFLGAPYLSDEKFKNMFQVIGLTNIDKAIAAGKGVILLSSHIGNWELMGSYLSSCGYSINVVARKIYDERLNKILLNHRSSRGVKTLMREEATKDMIRVLKSKEVLGILIDQDADVKGEFVEFFGREAYTPIGATILAMKYNVVVLPTFTNRIGNNKHVIDIGEPIELIQTDDEKSDIIKNTQKLNDIIEARIKKYPEQWVWLHKRWRDARA